MEKIILFDLDSTLLQMNQDLFLKKYFFLVGEKAKELGYNKEDFMKVFIKSAYSIIDNDGSQTNEELFWSNIKKEYPEISYLKEQFMKFYMEEFNSISEIVYKSSLPNDIIHLFKEKGYRIILATNPLFPVIATYQRMKWAGLNPKDFDYITTYEECRYCKPNRKYYLEIFEKMNISMEESIMVGNDTTDDFLDLPEGIKKILITDYLICKPNEPITIPAFSLAEFYQYAKENL